MHNSAQLRCFENGNDDFGVEAFWIGDAARVGYFVPLNGPLNGHPPSTILSVTWSYFILSYALSVTHVYEIFVHSVLDYIDITNMHTISR